MVEALALFKTFLDLRKGRVIKLGELIDSCLPLVHTPSKLAKIGKTLELLVTR